MAAPGLGKFYRFGPAIVPQADNFTKQLNYNFTQLSGVRLVLPNSNWPGGVVSGVTYGAIFYVATDGADIPASSGGGTVTAPWLTLTYAMSQLTSSFDFGGQVVLLQAVAGPGSFTSKLSITPWVGGGTFTFDGAGKSISVTNDRAIDIGGDAANGGKGGALPGPVTLQNVALSATQGSDPNSGRGISAVNPATVLIKSGMSFGACGGHQIFAGVGAFFDILADYSITGSAATHWNAAIGGLIFFQFGQTITISNGLNFGAFCNCSFGGNAAVGGLHFQAPGGAPPNTTGQKWSATLNGVISTNNAGVNYLPGTTNSFTKDSGGQYS